MVWEELILKRLTRRGFFKASATGAMAVAASRGEAFAVRPPAETTRSGARQGVPNPFTKDGKPLLVVVEGSNHEAMLEAGLEAIGGLGKLVQNGKPVVLKPNLVNAQPYPVTTDPDFVFTLTRHLRKAGCGELTICDSPSSAGEKKDLPFVKNGYFERGKVADVKVVAVDKQSDEDYLVSRDGGWPLHPQIQVDRRLFDATIIINLPTLKRHFIPGMVCALKNHFGSVHGNERRKAHQEARKGGQGLLYFKKSIAEFADAVKSELTIVDARSLLIKGGPSLGGGSAEVKSGVNRMIFGGDMVAVEAYSTELLKEHDDTFSPAMADATLAHAQDLSLGIGDLKQVEVIELSV